MSTRTEAPQVEMHVTMPDGTVWAVPADMVARNRADWYGSRGEDWAAIYNETLADDHELEDWAANNMDWSDVEAHARRVEDPGWRVDYQEGWVNGDKRIVRPEASR